MTKKLNFRKIGFISKLNGFKGELVLASDEDGFFDNEFLFMQMDGIPVPFYVEDIFEKGGNVIVKFEDVNDEAEAQRFLRKEVFAELKKKDKSASSISVKDLVGYHIIDSIAGDLGPIASIEEFPQQEIAVCNIKGKQVLIPLNADFINGIDDEERKVYVNLPSGLVDLYLE